MELFVSCTLPGNMDPGQRRSVALSIIMRAAGSNMIERQQDDNEVKRRKSHTQRTYHCLGVDERDHHVVMSQCFDRT